MQKRKKFRLLYFITIPLVLFILFVTFMTLFEYTVVAELKESFTAIDKEETLAYGKVLFETRGCSTCHAIDSDLKSLGPNLSGLAQRQSTEYIRQSIVSPNTFIVTGYEDVKMPNFGEILDNSQIDALVEYILSIK